MSGGKAVLDIVKTPDGVPWLPCVETDSHKLTASVRVYEAPSTAYTMMAKISIHDSVEKKDAHMTMKVGTTYATSRITSTPLCIPREMFRHWAGKLVLTIEVYKTEPVLITVPDDDADVDDDDDDDIH